MYPPGSRPAIGDAMRWTTKLSRPHRRSLLARSLPAALLAPLSALFLGACAGGNTPQDAVREYAGAVDDGNADRAWRLTSPRYRAGTSRARFEAVFADRAEAGPEYADQLRAAARNDAELDAKLEYSGFETVTLAYTPDGWRITGGVGAFFSQSSPRDTLATFIRAVRRGDTATLARLVPAEYRAQISDADLARWLEARADELADTIALIEASSDAPIRQRDGTAVLRYGAREMEFRLEGGRWVIADFD